MSASREMAHLLHSEGYQSWIQGICSNSGEYIQWYLFKDRNVATQNYSEWILLVYKKFVQE